MTADTTLHRDGSAPVRLNWIHGGYVKEMGLVEPRAKFSQNVFAGHTLQAALHVAYVRSVTAVICHMRHGCYIRSLHLLQAELTTRCYVRSVTAVTGRADDPRR